MRSPGFCPIPTVRLRDFADGRKAVVWVTSSANRSWRGAISSGRRDLRLAYSQSRDHPLNDLNRLEIGLSQIEKYDGTEVVDSMMLRQECSAIDAQYRDHPKIVEFAEFCGRSTISSVMAGHDPNEFLARMDAVVGFDAVEAFCGRWPFLQKKFENLLRPGMGYDKFMEYSAKRYVESHGDAPGWRGRTLEDVFAMAARAISAQGVDTAAEILAQIMEPFQWRQADVFDADSILHVMKNWRGMPTGVGSADSIFALGRSIPADWMPRTPLDADSFGALSSSIDSLKRASNDSLDVRTMVSSSKGRWYDFDDLFHRKGGMLGFPDMLRAFMEQVALPAAWHAFLFADGSCGISEAALLAAAESAPKDGLRKAANDVSCRLLFGGKSLPAMAEAVFDWHRRMTAMEKMIGTWPDVEWDTPLERFEKHGMIVAPIRTAMDLREEGLVMNHCVGGNSYVSACVERRLVIASVRRAMPSGGEERISTVELTGWTPGKIWAPRVKQHMGPSNTTPGPDAKKALEAMLHFHATDARAAPMAFEQTAGPVDLVRWRAGYDWLVPGMIENAIRQWAHFLPKDVAREGLDWFVPEMQSRIDMRRRSDLAACGATS